MREWPELKASRCLSGPPSSRMWIPRLRLFDQRRNSVAEPVRDFRQNDRRTALHGDIAGDNLHRSGKCAVALKEHTRSARLVERSPKLNVGTGVDGPVCRIGIF